MSHALGNDKRFVPVLGRQRYEVEDRLHLRVEAYDRNYQPLRGDDLPGGMLDAQLLVPQPNGATKRRDFKVPFLQRGIFETEIQLFEPGEYRVGMLDPIEEEWVFRPFYVTDRSAERQQVVRNTDLQDRLALQTQGESFDLREADRVAELINPSPILSTNERDHALWKSPLWFILLSGLLLTEWFIRKQAHLT